MNIGFSCIMVLLNLYNPHISCQWGLHEELLLSTVLSPSFHLFSYLPLIFCISLVPAILLALASFCFMQLFSKLCPWFLLSSLLVLCSVLFVFPFSYLMLNDGSSGFLKASANHLTPEIYYNIGYFDKLLCAKTPFAYFGNLIVSL